MRRITIIAAAAGLLILVGCGEGEGGKSGGGGGANSADASGASSDMRLQPGEWEISFETTSVSAPGLPKAADDATSVAKQTVKSCISEEEANKPNADFFQPKRDGNCKTESYSMAGGRVTGTMTCEGIGGQGRTEVKLDGRYSSTSFDMTSRTQVQGGGMNMTMEMKSSGRRLGDCPSGAQGS